MEIKISVIVPIYNTEKFLEKCITSILLQTYKNIEIILVDDGSTDSSGKICDLFAKQDSRIVVVHKTNEGLVSARQEGVKYATGSYIGFVDSDDWIDSDMISELAKLVIDEDADIVSSGLMYENGAKRVHSIREGVYSQEKLSNIYSKMIYDIEKDMPGVVQSVCTKLFKTRLLKNIVKNLDKNLTLGEDAALTYNFLINSSKIIITNKCYYYYRTNLESMRYKYDPLVFHKICIFQDYVKNSFENNYYRHDLEKQLKLYIEQFIRMIAEQFFNIKYRNSYILPEEIFQDYTNIILYGAGEVGISYYRKMLKNKRINIVKWVDRNLTGSIIENRIISSPEEITSLKYDIILIAVRSEELSTSIKKQLVDCGIEERKIVWKYPEKEIMIKEIFV